MRIFVVLIISLFTVATITMVVANRGSERIVTTFFLGLIATFGALMALFFYGSDEPIHKAFSSVVMIDAASHLPYELMGFTNIPMESLILTRDEIKKRPEPLSDATDSQSSKVYHHALQRAIISWFELKYPTTWAGLLSRRCCGLKVPPQTGSSGLAPAFAKNIKKRIEMLGEDRRCESLLASEVVIERAFRDADGRGYVPNADARVSEPLKQHGC
jgi:hypothetical protein